MKCKVHNNANYEGLDSLAEDLFKFAHKRFNFTKPVTIVFESSMDNVGKLFAPTGHYDPQSSKVIIYVDHRHPKDILRSLAHELVHHKQNCVGRFAGGVSTDPGYAQRDQHMREMEGDAYRTGNIMLFRDWEDNYKKGSTIMNENKEKITEGGDYERSIMARLEGGGTVTDRDLEYLADNNPELHQKVQTAINMGKVSLESHREKLRKAQGLEEGHEEEECDGEDCPEKEEKEEPVKEWYQNQLHEALLKKFKIKK